MISPLTRAMRATRNANATLLLYQIHFWHRRSPGWIPKTSAVWSDETGLTAKQLRGALALLETLGLVARKQVGHRGSVILHVGLTPSGEAIFRTVSTPSGVGPVGPNGPTPPVPVGPNGPTAPVPPTYSYSEEIQSQRELRYAHGEDVETEPIGGKRRKTAAEILQANKSIGGSKLDHYVAQARGFTGLEIVFRECFRIHFGNSPPYWSPSDRGKMRHWVARTPKGEASKLLVGVIARWPQYVAYVAEREDLGSIPPVPTVSFLSRFAGHAEGFRAAKKAPPSKGAVMDY